MNKIALDTPGKTMGGDSYNIETVAGMPGGGEDTLFNVIQNSLKSCILIFLVRFSIAFGIRSEKEAFQLQVGRI